MSLRFVSFRCVCGSPPPSLVIQNPLLWINKMHFSTNHTKYFHVINSEKAQRKISCVVPTVLCSAFNVCICTFYSPAHNVCVRVCYVAGIQWIRIGFLVCIRCCMRF